MPRMPSFGGTGPAPSNRCGELQNRAVRDGPDAPVASAAASRLRPAAPPRPPAETPPPAKSARPAASPAPSVIERRKARRIATGQVEIDARLDLHGLREGEAFRRLQSFLADAGSRGLRTVLVITGKGRPRRRADADDGLGPSGETGVIRRNVPRWLAEPALASLVISFAPAHVRHGGEGALYLYLRKPRRG